MQFSLHVFMCLTLCLLSLSSQADTLSELNHQGRVSVSASLANAQSFLEAEKPVSVYQQLVLTVKVATDTWFTKGTRVHRFDVPNALVLSRNSSAFNTTERHANKTYSVQEWEVVIYPLESGDYVVPSITVELTTKTEKGEVHGLLTTKPLSFSVLKPVPEMTKEHRWFVGSGYEMSQQWTVTKVGGTESDDTGDNESFSALEVGDSIRRKITLNVKDTTATLLPDLIEKMANNESESTNGLLVYSHPATLRDSEFRGEYSASKSESVTYVLNHAGEITLPSTTLYFWNAQEQHLESVIIKGNTLNVSHTAASWLWCYRYHIMIPTMIMCFVGGAGLFGYRRFQYMHQQNDLPSWWYYLSALYRKDYVGCETVLYRQQMLSVNQLKLRRKGVSTKYEIAISEIQEMRYAGGVQVEPPKRVYWLLFVIAFLRITFKHRN